MAQSCSSTVEKLMTERHPAEETSSAKVTMVGVGQVGMAAAFSIMSQGVASELALVDVAAEKLRGEMLDLQHGQAFMKRVTIKASTDYSVTAGSRICIVTAGARQREGESRLNLVQRNVNIFKSIIPNLVKYSPDCILIIVSNPVAAWSGVTVGGVHLTAANPNIGTDEDPENWAALHKDVINSAYEVIKLKGYTSWAIGVMVATLVGAILKNQRNVYALSTVAKGSHGIQEEVFLSLPCVVGESGITHVFHLQLNDKEQSKLQQSARVLSDVIANIQF